MKHMIYTAKCLKDVENIIDMIQNSRDYEPGPLEHYIIAYLKAMFMLLIEQNGQTDIRHVYGKIAGFAHSDDKYIDNSEFIAIENDFPTSAAVIYYELFLLCSTEYRKDVVLGAYTALSRFVYS